MGRQLMEEFRPPHEVPCLRKEQAATLGQLCIDLVIPHQFGKACCALVRRLLFVRLKFGFGLLGFDGVGHVDGFRLFGICLG